MVNQSKVTLFVNKITNFVDKKLWGDADELQDKIDSAMLIVGDKPVVVLNKNYLVQSDIEIPGNVIINGNGHTIDFDFTGKIKTNNNYNNNIEVRFNDIIFTKGETGLQINEKCNVFISNCNFVLNNESIHIGNYEDTGLTDLDVNIKIIDSNFDENLINSITIENQNNITANIIKCNFNNNGNISHNGTININCDTTNINIKECIFKNNIGDTYTDIYSTNQLTVNNCEMNINNSYNITNNEIKTISEVINTIYPIGSIYMSVNSTSPATLFGGQWEQLTDTFLLACGSTYSSDGNQVTSAQHGSSQTKLVKHTHTGLYHRHQVGSHDHTIAHTHTVKHSHTANHKHTVNAHSHKPLDGTSFIETNATALATGSAKRNAPTNDGGNYYWQSNQSSPPTISRHTTTANASPETNNITLNTSENTPTTSDSSASKSGTASPYTDYFGSDNTKATNEAGSINSSNSDNMPPYMAVYMWKRKA